MNPQFLLKPLMKTEVVLSLTQMGGRLPLNGVYSSYPFIDQIKYSNVGVFRLPPGQETINIFDKNNLVFLGPLKRERENPAKITLEAGQSYVVVCALEEAGKKGKFALSVYFNQTLENMDIRRVFAPGDKNADKEDVLPKLIPEEAEKMKNRVPLWKIELIRESVKFMVSGEDEDQDDMI